MHHACRRIINIDDGRAFRIKHVKERGFRFAVALHRAVVIKMIAREIRKDRHAKCQCRDALLIERMAGYFHRRRTTTVVDHAREEIRQLNRRRRRQLRWHALETIISFNGADKSAAHASRHKQLLHEIRNRGLAVGTRDAHKRERLRWVREESFSDDCGSVRRIIDFNPRNDRRITR